MIRLSFFVFVFLFGSFISEAQTVFFDASGVNNEVLSGHLKMGNPGPDSAQLLVNNRYLTLHGKPIVPVMGEMHFSRCPEAEWEHLILKMKANGINIIATYIFWIYHEEIEGRFDWSGNKNFRKFIELCAQHGMWVYPRLGPWCHGEVRNGAMPDWILNKTNMSDRTNHPVYQYYAERWLGEVANQMSGLYYKDGGPVIGVQLENEYWRGNKGEEHIAWLKQVVRKLGVDVPLYTVTGWRHASVPQDEVIPLWGGYPAAPWATNIQSAGANPVFNFESPANVENIGNEVSTSGGYSVDYSRYPYFTCELGVGNQITYHRRPVIGSLDGLAIATVKIGSGSNLPGYYVFAGGSNPVGLLTTLQEEKDETGYWNDYPVISYDFQAAIRETGELSPAYQELKKLHYFLNEFGDRLAPMSSVLPEPRSDQTLRCAVRAKDNSGFLFVSNYSRNTTLTPCKKQQFSVTTNDEDIVLPNHPVAIPDSSVFIWPFNFEMGAALLKYATAQPVAKMDGFAADTWFFVQNGSIVPEFVLNAASVTSVVFNHQKVKAGKDDYVVRVVNPGIQNGLEFLDINGAAHRIVVLSHAETQQMWLLSNDLGKNFFVSDVNLTLSNESLHLFGEQPTGDVFAFEDNSFAKLPQALDTLGWFTRHLFNQPAKSFAVKVKPQNYFDRAKWLKSTPEKVSSRQQLFHTFFVKEIGVYQTSEIKSATLFCYSDVEARLRVNGRWVNQNLIAGKANAIDLTGYLRKGENVLLVDVPFVESNGGWIASLVLDFLNSDRMEIPSDRSWLSLTDYRIPVYGHALQNPVEPVVMDNRPAPVDIPGWPIRYAIELPDLDVAGLQNLYLNINYRGDKARLRLNNRLVADNFYNGEVFSVALKKLRCELNAATLELEVSPLKKEALIYFEKVDRSTLFNPGVTSVTVKPIYSSEIDVE
jgi:hypothetical protein